MMKVNFTSLKLFFLILTIEFPINVHANSVGRVSSYNPNARLIGASLPDFEEFPYIAYVKPDNGLFCTGVLLSLQHILIPSNCYLTEPSELNIVVGTNDPTLNEISSQTTEIPSYEIDTVEIPNLDLMILTLPQEFRETSAVREIPIANTYLPNQAGYFIVGFPDIHRNRVVPSGGEIHVVKLNTNANNKTYCVGQSIPESQMCTGTILGGSGVCATNGGILIRKSGGIDEVYGMIDKQCCGLPRCFDTFWDLTNPEVKSWIQDMIEQSGSEGPETANTEFSL